MPKKTPRPRPLSGAGRGKGPGARVFRGPVRPVTNSNYIKAFWEPIEVSSTLGTANDCPDNIWEYYDHEEYNSSCSEEDYFPTDDDSLLSQTDESSEDSEDFGIIVDFTE